MCPFTGADAGMAPGVSAIVSALSARDKALLLPTAIGCHHNRVPLLHVWLMMWG